VTSGARIRAAEGDGARYFTDAEGRRWRVTEDPTPLEEWTSADEETRHAGYPVGWLSFVCDTMQKRLRLFPARWRALSDAELDRLCRRARLFPSAE
jgi:hypothetical protein